ncbi:MAG TPA: 50S ribosomal protein L20 [Bacteroidales bacterium]|jgi:large subunit ribosomal protein L20|nr:50S ribosomal protein L20 [Bacteroidales bacterium]HQN99303.1 50S ribosomal protein L20 [Bacteroidales bacterium]HQQ02989.1 50S ribosomal protein L20 [Bacteroidales bacterium]
MPRSVNVVASHRRRRKLLRKTRGQYGRRKNVWTVAKNSWEKGQQYAYRDRRAKKRSFRALWISRINAGIRQYGMSYSEFMGKLNKANIRLNRKVLADLAMNHPDAFKAVVDQL